MVQHDILWLGGAFTPYCKICNSLYMRFGPFFSWPTVVHLSYK